MAVRVSRALLREMERAAESAYPEECCGLLVGRPEAGGGIALTRRAASPNLSPVPHSAFEIDPQLWLDLRRALAGGPEALVGLHHSHPDGAPEPSARDLAAAWEEGMLWLVTAVARGRAGETTAHRFEGGEAAAGEASGGGGGGFTPVALRIVS